MLDPGHLLNHRYEIQSVAGEGGMGSVYLALDCNLGRKKVAVKEMAVAARHPEDRALAMEQFRQEARLLATLDNPRLVPVTDFFECDGSAYLVMAYVDGQTLSAVAASRDVRLDEIVEWADQIAQILEYLHEHEPPVLFRDLKPGNVMLDDHDRIRLIDFGIARTLVVGEDTSTFLKGAGTAEYAPVEQFGGRGTDARSDLYALGATMYNLLTGEAPPIAVDVLTGEVPAAAPRDVHDAVPPALDALVRKAMAVKKEDRYASARDLRLDLARISPAELTALARRPRTRPTRAASGQPLTELGPAPPPPPPSSGALPDIPEIPRPPLRNPLAPYLAAIVVLLMLGMLWSAATLEPLPDPSGSPGPEASGIPPGAATLIIESAPPGARVFIDDRPTVGQKGEPVTPMAVLVTPGNHLVRMEKDGLGTFITTIADLVSGQSRRLTASLTPPLTPAPSARCTLQVASRPPGAHIIVDDSLVMDDQRPVTTPASVPLDPGRHRIQVETSGYETFTTYVRIADGQHRELQARLVPALSTAPRLHRWEETP